LNQADGSCALCLKEPVETFKYWKIVANDFPYDLIAREHNMLLPMRHIAEDGLSSDELRELIDIKMNHLDPKYDYVIEAAPKNKSIPDHFHLHLIVMKNSLDKTV
jgi:hypothetical protein